MKRVSGGLRIIADYRPDRVYDKLNYLLNLGPDRRR
jgi:hypothetical protein